MKAQTSVVDLSSSQIARTLSSGTSPAMGVNWWMPESEACDPIGTRFQRFSLEVSDLRAEVTRLMSVLTRNNDGLDIMLEMLRKCQDMDRRIATWLERLDDEYQPQPLYWEEDWTSGLFLGNGEGAGAGGGANALLKQASVFPGRVDVYRDLITACLWNGQRSTRIILGSLIIRVAAWICSPADHRSTPEYATAMGTMQEAIAGIISSVPFMLGTFSTQPQQSLQPLQQLQQQQAVSAGHFLCGADEQAKMVGGLMVSWPLSTVRTCDFTTDEQRLWTVGRLNYISNDLGIRYADAFAGVSTKRNPPQHFWFAYLQATGEKAGTMMETNRQTGQDSLPLDADASRWSHDQRRSSQGNQSYGV